MKLKRDFFERDTLIVAKQLLGKYLVYGDLVGQITETEAYIGKDDPACHACKGLTPRTKPMFGPAGFSYVYFIYGMYFCFNIVTEKEGFPAAVLIRGVRPIEGVEIMQERRGEKVRHVNLTNGPGKLCQAFGLTKQQNNLDMCGNSNFYVEDRGDEFNHFKQTPRIGIKEGLEHYWRFVVE